MIKNNIDKANIPHKPGVYIFKSSQAEVLYVGKAIDLYHRVRSYFSKSNLNLKTQQLVNLIKAVETITVESELEALILEANLIKKFLPPFNVRLTDDKDYLYIKVTKEKFPRIITARKKDLTASLKYFGPFPSSTTVKTTLKKLRRIFPWCANPPGSKNKLSRSCFYYHLGLCPGPCAGKIDQKEYLKIITRFVKFMEGKKDQLVWELSQEMIQFSQRLDFESANSLKKIIQGIEYLLSPTKIDIYLENPNFIEDQLKVALEKLKQDLNLQKLPERIEGYDISNIQGKDATGSMVVLINGEIDKSQYRKFRIKISGRPNDVAMLKEVMARRLNHPEWPFPQLIIIDGGRGQVRGVKQILDQKNVHILIFGLAKRLEWIYPPQGAIIKLSKKSLSLRLLQKLRDEAHRFAITYHRKLHQRAFV